MAELQNDGHRPISDDHENRSPPVKKKAKAEALLILMVTSKWQIYIMCEILNCYRHENNYYGTQIVLMHSCAKLKWKQVAIFLCQQYASWCNYDFAEISLPRYLIWRDGLNWTHLDLNNKVAKNYGTTAKSISHGWNVYHSRGWHV